MIRNIKGVGALELDAENSATFVRINDDSIGEHWLPKRLRKGRAIRVLRMAYSTGEQYFVMLPRRTGL
jgi:hypothetical protein